MIVTDEKIISLIGFARQMNCTDIHISTNRPVVVRRMGELIKTNFEASDSEIKEMIMSMLDEDQKKLIKNKKDVITTFETPQSLRQRVSVYMQNGELAASVRLLPSSVISLEEMNIPEAMVSGLTNSSGLTLITGPAGNGKTTTAVSLLHQVCSTNPIHVITLEKPVEYLFKGVKATVHQRQVGTDVESFSIGCRYASREDADILFISDIFDFDTLNAAVTAAESGISVIACFDANSVVHAFDSIEEMCPPDRQERFRIRLANVIRSMITQKLVPSADGESTVLVNEILICNDAVLNIIRQDKKRQLTNVMQTNASAGMHTLNSILVKLCTTGVISRESAIKCSPDRDDLLQYLKK